MPARIFDFHMHVARARDLDPVPGFVATGPAELGLKQWRAHFGRQVGPAKLYGALCTPMPSKNGDPAAANAYAASEAAAAKGCCAHMIITPSSRPEDAERTLDTSPARIIGFKVYHLYADRERTFECEPHEYIPEWAWPMADERGLTILLHMVRLGALADPANQAYIRSHCERYPNARLVLAHAARGFHAANTVRGLAAIEGLENVWFDTSAIGEAEPIAAILDAFGPRRLLWGSDFPVSAQRGRAISLGSGFAWIATDQIEWNERAFFGEPVQVGLESLKATLDAADQAHLSPAELQDVFCDNALRLTGLATPVTDTTARLYERALRIIPGGVQLLSKRPEMFAPGQWPAYFSEARGCEVRDLDGRRYIDVSIHGIGACLLGYRDPHVTRAVQRRVARGSYSILNPAEEVELAERLCALHPWAQQARFTRTGGEMMSVAVRIARATTDRPVVAVCGYHGWHDWYLAANLGESDALRGMLLPGLDPLGVPRELRGTTRTFAQNDVEALERIVNEEGNRLAAVVMEPCRSNDPAPGFLQTVRDLTRRAGALLVFDEITMGFRLARGGAHLGFGIEPDLAVFAKSLGNGHPIAAVIGTEPAMRGAHGSFISSTYWTEGVGPVAALATLDRMAAVDIPAHCARAGARVQKAWQSHGERHGLPITVADGYPALARFAFDHPAADRLKTLYVQEMLERGFLASPAFYACLAHTDDILDGYAAAIDGVFETLADALRADDLDRRLKGPVAHSGFRRLTH